MELLLIEGQAWLNEAISARKILSQSLLKSGELLASKIRERAIDLSHDRATEFSPDIELLHFMAAKVAFLVFGKNSTAGEVYEKDASYYLEFPSSASRSADYMDFKQSRN